MGNNRNPVRVLVSGPGLIGRKHIGLVGENPATELAGIVGPLKEQHAAFAADQGVPLYADVESALDALEVNGVIIASPNNLHLDQALASISKGIPTLIEKPLGASLADAKAIVEASERAGVPVLVGHHRTYSPWVQAAHEFLVSPEFGQPVALQGSALFYKPSDYFSAAPWRARSGGGPILINLIHEVGLWRSLFGEITSVSAVASFSTRQLEVEDSAAIALSFDNGALGAFMLSDTSASSKSWEMTTGENPAYPHFPLENCYHFAGTAGSLDFPSMRFRTYLGQPERSWRGLFKEGQIIVEGTDPLATQLDHFVAVLRGEALPLVSAQDGYLNMLVLEAITRSAESGRRVCLAELCQ
jgi:predicted dehydrogenase